MDPITRDFGTLFERIDALQKTRASEISHFDLAPRDNLIDQSELAIIEAVEGSIKERLVTHKAQAIEELKTPSLSQKIINGALAGLLGTAAGAASGLAVKAKFGGVSSLFHNATGTPSGTDIAATGIGAAIGVLTTSILWNCFQAHDTGRYGKQREDFEEEIKDLPITKAIREKLTEKIKDVAILFAYREMLFLGSINSDDTTNYRKNLEDHLIKTNIITEEMNKRQREKYIDAAIERYFLNQLSVIFGDVFEQTWEIQDADFEEQNRSYLKRFFSSLLHSDEVKENFTQQIQLQFMEATSTFLRNEKDEKNFFGRHKLEFKVVGGIIVAGIVIAAIASNPAGWATAAVVATAIIVGGIGFGIGYAVTRLLFKCYPSLLKKRDRRNRKSIEDLTTEVSDKVVEISTILDAKPKTTSEDIEKLEKLKDEDSPHFFNFFGDKVRLCALGSAASWVREYNKRYLHSERTSVELRGKIIKIINESQRQNEAILREIKADTKRTKPSRKLSEFFDKTTTYLKDKEHQDDIELFELRDKMREQILTLVAAIPDTVKDIPDELAKLYTLPIKEGGLNGQLKELEMARTLAPSRDSSTTNDFKKLRAAADDMKDKMQQRSHQYPSALQGDETYCMALGITCTTGDISPDTFDQRLSDSFDFLFSLLDPIDASQNIFKVAHQSQASLIYRGLLFKQLATLYLENETNPLIKAKIKSFLQDRFGLNANLIFDDIASQADFPREVEDFNPSQAELPAAPLKDFADALRLDIAYSNNALSPRLVLEKEIISFARAEGLEEPEDKLPLIGIGHRQNINFTAGPDEESCQRLAKFVDKTIAFIGHLQKKPYLQRNGFLTAYCFETSRQVYTEMVDIVIKMHALSQSPDVSTTQTVNYIRQFQMLNEFVKEYGFPLGMCPAREVINVLSKLPPLDFHGQDDESVEHLAPLVSGLDFSELQGIETMYDAARSSETDDELPSSLKDYLASDLHHEVEGENPPKHLRKVHVEKQGSHQCHFFGRRDSDSRIIEETPQQQARK